MTGHPGGPVPGGPVSVAGGSVWAVPEFRALWVSLMVTLAGDQLARVALTVVLYSATGSPVWAAVGGAVTLLAPMAGGLLAGLGDRYPRRRVMIGTQVASGWLVAAMAFPGVPLPVLVVLVFTAALLSTPFAAARMALLREVFPDDRRYAAAVAVGQSTAQVAIVAGLLAGGAAVAALGVQTAVLANAVAFAASALILSLALPATPPPARPEPAPSGPAAAHPAAQDRVQDQVQGPVVPRPVVRGPAAWRPAVRESVAWLIATDSRLRTPALYAALAGFRIAPAGVAAPYAAAHGGGAGLLAALMAVQSAGFVVGAWLLTRRPAVEQRRWLVPGAVLSALPLVGTATDPGLVAVMALWAVAGAASAHQVVAQTLFMGAAPAHRRAHAAGLVSSALLGVQGLGMLAAATLAGWIGPANAVAVLGAAGTLAALALAPAGRHLTATTPAEVTR